MIERIDTADLALAKQAFEEVLSLCPPEQMQTWQATDEQRTRYLELGDRVIFAVGKLEDWEKRQLLDKGRIQQFIPDALLVFVREQLMPRFRALRDALDYLDPDNKLMRDFWWWDPAGGNKWRILSTFEVGIEQIDQLIECLEQEGQERPGLDPDRARDVLDSPLIRFEPDAWLTRANELRPIRTRKTSELPTHVRLRLEELYRAYLFGLWISTFGLARAILEYAIHDNLRKLGIDSCWPPERDGSRTDKKLSHLIDEVAEHLPQLRESLGLINAYGNEYLHPRKSKVDSLVFRREQAARETVEKLVEVVEAIYLSPSNTETLSVRPPQVS